MIEKRQELFEAVPIEDLPNENQYTLMLDLMKQIKQEEADSAKERGSDKSN